MKKQLIISILGLLLLTSHSLFAQKDRNAGIINSYLIGLEYEVKAGFSIGGTSPLPLPKEIRSIDSYKPTLQIAIEGNVTKWLNPARTWGIMLALRLETKGMKTDARVKNYSMEIIGDGGERMKGFWTGQVKTKVNNSYLTVPVLAAWRVSPRWKLNAGPFPIGWKAILRVMCTTATCVNSIRPVTKSYLKTVKVLLTIFPKTCVVLHGGYSWEANGKPSNT